MTARMVFVCVDCDWTGDEVYDAAAHSYAADPGTHSTRGEAMTFDETSSAITSVALLQVALLDHTGHVYRGKPRAEAVELAAEINRLRSRVGWRPLDMAGRWRRVRAT